MITVSIMQPYFFPYIGYFALIATSDLFLVLDDVNFPKKKFVNRNFFIDEAGEKRRFTLPLVNASQNRKINEISIFVPGKKGIHKIRSWISGLPYRKDADITLDFFFDQLNSCNNISTLNTRMIKFICANLNIETKFIDTLDGVCSEYSGEERILKLVKRFEGSKYLNLPGGRKLYHKRDFFVEGLDLEFIELDEEFRALGRYSYASILQVIGIFGYGSLFELLAQRKNEINHR